MGIYFLPFACLIFVVQTLTLYELVDIQHVAVLHGVNIYIDIVHAVINQWGIIFAGVCLVCTLFAFIDKDNNLKLRKQVNVLGYIFGVIALLSLL